jgi:diguanylate cyclase (GGDEF)-like protein/hemerythrin-like metal-binding protein
VPRVIASPPPYAELGTLSQLLSFWLFLGGIHIFQNQDGGQVRSVHLRFVATSALILLFAALAQPPQFSRPVASLMIALLAGVCAFLLFGRNRGEAVASARFTGAIFVLSAVMHAAGAAFALGIGGVNWNLLQAADMLLLIGWNFGFLMLIGQRNQERIADLANHDELTGVHTRRSFMSLAHQLFSIFERQQKPLAVLMMDIDHFKLVNDTHGHAAGDCTLKRFTDHCQSCLRASDLLGRIGGEEFCIVLPDTGLEGIRAGFEAGESSWRGKRLTATVSIGVAMHDKLTDSFEVLMARADEALYRAKNGGRNRLVSFDEQTASQPLFRLVWESRYLSGDQTIDTEHEYLFNWANTLLEKMQSNADSAAIAADLKEKLHWLKEHFRNEERILARHGGAGLARHAAQHKSLAARGDALLVEVSGGARNWAELLDFVVLEVIARHLAREDSEYFSALQTRRTT